MRGLLRYYERVFIVFKNEPALHALAYGALTVLLIGTTFYHFVEGWNWLDSFYFCTVTLATVGYGDLAPSSDVSRAFTAIYVFLGIGIVATFITAVARAPLVVGEDNERLSQIQGFLSMPTGNSPTTHAAPSSPPRRYAKRRSAAGSVRSIQTASTPQRWHRVRSSPNVAVRRRR